MNRNKIYGYEDYNIYCINSDIVNDAKLTRYHTYDYSWHTGRYVQLPKHLYAHERSRSEYVKVFNSMIKENKELLVEGKKVYVHPDCKLPRTTLYQKYKKCNNPWIADIVVIPKFDANIFDIDENYAVFVNEDTKDAFGMRAEWYDRDTHKYVHDLISVGDKLGDIAKASAESFITLQAESNFNMLSLYNSICDYLGPMCKIYKNNSALEDILTSNLPLDKAIYEDTIMASLSSQENQISVEVLSSIREMLDSDDIDTRASAIKALAQMDYMSYPISVEFVLLMSGRYLYDNACNSTAAKFMFKTLFGGTARSRRRSYATTISQKDFDVFLPLVKQNYKTEDDNEALACVDYYDFLYRDADYKVRARIK